MAKCVFLAVLLTATLCSECVRRTHAVRTTYEYESGPYTVVYYSRGTPTLRVIRDSRTVWFTSATNATFVTAALVKEEVKQNGGVFLFSIEVQEVCSEMKITAEGSRTPSTGYPQVLLLLPQNCQKHDYCSRSVRAHCILHSLPISLLSTLHLFLPFSSNSLLPFSEDIFPRLPVQQRSLRALVPGRGTSKQHCAPSLQPLSLGSCSEIQSATSDLRLRCGRADIRIRGAVFQVQSKRRTISALSLGARCWSRT